MRFVIAILIYIFIGESLLYSDSKDKNSYREVNSAVLFMYHRFGDERYPSTNVTLEQFEKHLEYIEKNNFNVWPLSKIVRYISEKKQLPEKTIAITIDDAYITVYTNAYPRLKAKKMPFTVFVNTNAVDVKSKNYISWEKMREMQLNGVEFANHSLTHAYLLQSENESKEEWRTRVMKEVEGAQKRLQDELGDDVNKNPQLFSYPFGEHDKSVRELLKELNYIGVAQASGVFSESSDLQEIPRYAMAEAFAEIDDFALKINTLPLPIESAYPNDTRVKDNNPPKLRLKLKREIEGIQCYRANGEKIEMEWISSKELEIQSKTPLNAPRDRYTCTARSKENKWYWYSKFWILK